MANASSTWLGHAAFRIDSPGGKRIYVDPWLDNPKCPRGREKPRAGRPHRSHARTRRPRRLDGRAGAEVRLSCRCDDRAARLAFDERASADDGRRRRTRAARSRRTASRSRSPTRSTRAAPSRTERSSISASQPASSSSSRTERRSTSPATRASSATWRSSAGSTSRIVAVLPIGGHFTMDPREAAVALELLGVERCVPCHYGTFPLLAGTPEECRKLVSDCEIVAPQPGESVEV